MEPAPSVPVDVSEILEDSTATVVADGSLAVESVDVGPLTFPATSPARYEVALTNVGTGILALGEVRLDVTATCSRCLVTYALELAGRIERFWVQEEDAVDGDDGPDIEPLDGTTIDLGPAIHASLAAEVPWIPVHSEDCLGLCAVCGGDLNEVTCDCEPARLASPFSALEGLLEDGDGDGTD